MYVQSWVYRNSINLTDSTGRVETKKSTHNNGLNFERISELKVILYSYLILKNINERITDN